MKLLGLTGGIAMGKTTVAAFFAGNGASVVDADSLARQLVEPGQPALAEIQRVFGACLLEETGALRRAALARLVFEDADARKRLETILHPRIRERWLAAAAEWRKRGEALGVVIIPLLFETDAARHFDATVCVACTAASQSQRLAARGWTPEQSARRMQAQWPVEWKIDRADYVIWTEGELHVTAEQARRVQCSAG